MKKSVGVLFIVGGLSIVGYYLLTLTKPKDRESQLAELDQKAKDLATSMIDVDNSDITKAKALHTEWLKLRGNKTKESDYTNEELEKIRNIYSQLRQLKYYINGTELRRD
jgi:hypothetical protein